MLVKAASSPAVACATALASESSIGLGIDVMPHRCSGMGQVIQWCVTENDAETIRPRQGFGGTSSRNRTEETIEAAFAESIGRTSSITVPSGRSTR